MQQDPICITNYSTGEVLLVDQLTNETVNVIPVGEKPSGAVIGPDGKSIFVAYFGTGFVYVFDSITHLQTNEIVIPHVSTEGYAMVSDGDKVFLIPNRTANLIVIDPQTLEVSLSGNLREEDPDQVQVQNEISVQELGKVQKPKTQEIGQKLIPPAPALIEPPLQNIPPSDLLNVFTERKDSAPLTRSDEDLGQSQPISNSDLLKQFESGMPPNLDLSSLPPIPPHTIPSLSVGNMPNLSPSELNGLHGLNGPLASLSMDNPLSLGNTLAATSLKKRPLQRKRKALLLDLRQKVRRLNLPPEMAKKLEVDLSNATRHIQSFIKNLKTCVSLKLISLHKAAPIIKEAKRLLN